MSISGITSVGTNVVDVLGTLKALNGAGSTASTNTEETSVDAGATIETASTSDRTGSGTAGQLSSEMMGMLLEQQASNVSGGDAKLASDSAGGETGVARHAEDALLGLDTTAAASTGADNGGDAESTTGSKSTGTNSESSKQVYDSADTNEDGKVSGAERVAYDANRRSTGF